MEIPHYSERKQNNLRKESHGKFEDEVDIIPYRRASHIPKPFPCTRRLSAVKYIRSRIQLRGNYFHSGVVPLSTPFVKMSRDHYA